MRIKDLLEGQQFNDLDWVKKDGEKSEPNFDVAEDLIFFMNNDDDVYRRHVYPKIAHCIHKMESKKETSPDIFKPAVIECYKLYLKKYPIRELPIDMDEDLCKQTCKKIHEEVNQHISDGRYKD